MDSGFSLVESTIAVIMLLTAMLLTVQALSGISRSSREADRRAVALQEAANALERLASGIEDGETSPELSPGAALALPEGTIAVDRHREDREGVTLDRLSVTVRYREAAGEATASVHLTTWGLPTPGGDEEDER